MLDISEILKKTKTDLMSIYLKLPSFAHSRLTQPDSWRDW